MSATFKTLDELDLNNKRVLLRADLNVPFADGKVTDATRIERLVPTIREIVKHDGKAILLSHFGRPKGKVDPAFSLEQVCAAVADLTGHPVGFVATDWVDVSAAKKAIDAAPAGSVLVMENTRFHPGEEANDIELAQRMASLGDVYVNDAFSAAHRAHASTAALAHLLPAAAGLAMQSELEALEAGLGKPKKPVVAIVGMANTFLHAQGYGVGKSLCEKDLAETALRIMDKAIDSGCAIILPIDAVMAWHFKADTPTRLYGVDAMDNDAMMLDIGPSSIERIIGAIDDAHTVVWNGPMGAFEMNPFDAGTVAIAKHVAKRTHEGKLVSVAGGGDTVSALAHAGVKEQFTYVSTAGGAFLEWMEGKPLPGVDALKK
jgi:phosphoglycerate kinase